MQEYHLCDSEYRFMQVVWDAAPVASGRLVELCAQELGWKKSTTYTVLKKLCQQGLFENREGVVYVLISRENYCAMQSEKFVEETFDGSLPAFLAAFAARKPLSQAEIDQIRRMIDGFGEGAQ